MRRRYLEQYKPAEVEMECDGLKIAVAGISEASDGALINPTIASAIFRIKVITLKMRYGRGYRQPYSLIFPAK